MSVLIGRETVWPPVLTVKKHVHHTYITVEQIKRQNREQANNYHYTHKNQLVNYLTGKI